MADGVILPFKDLQETLQALREELQALRADDAGKEPRKVYERFLDWGAWTINSPDGPLWFRGYAEWSDAQGDAEVPRLLSAFGLSRFVVAHTPQADGHIHVRFGGKVFLIDTGMNTAFFKNGRGTALEIAGDTVRRDLFRRAAAGDLGGAREGRRRGPAPAPRSARRARGRAPRRLDAMSGPATRTLTLPVGRLGRMFNLRPGRGPTGGLLFAYLFLVITAYLLGKTARDALFLNAFKASKLPYADMAIAVSVGFIVAIYVAIGRRVLLRDLLVGCLLVFAALQGGFWYLAKYHPEWTWQYPVFYIWVGIFGVLAPTQVWTLANYLLTTREAKRVFGLVAREPSRGGSSRASWPTGSQRSRDWGPRACSS